MIAVASLERLRVLFLLSKRSLLVTSEEARCDSKYVLIVMKRERFLANKSLGEQIRVLNDGPPLA